MLCCTYCVNVAASSFSDADFSIADAEIRTDISSVRLPVQSMMYPDSQNR